MKQERAGREQADNVVAEQVMEMKQQLLQEVLARETANTEGSPPVLSFCGRHCKMCVKKKKKKKEKGKKRKRKCA